MDINNTTKQEIINVNSDFSIHPIQLTGKAIKQYKDNEHATIIEQTETSHKVR